MATSISKSFVAFLEDLGPTAPAADDTRLQALEKALVENGVITRCLAAGSRRTGTVVDGHSAIDVIAAVAPDHAQASSAVVMRGVAGALAQAVPDAQPAIEGPAVVVPFGDGKAERHRIIPAQSLGLGEDGEDIYGIPDASGGWLRTSPSLHRRYVDSQDRRADAAARPLIRFVKAWKHFNEVPISSFYLELVAATYVARHPSVLYTQALFDIFQGLWNHQLAPVTDPAHVAGLVQPCRHVFHRVATLEALKHGVERIEAARAAAKANRIREAIEEWNHLYNGRFPEYG